MSTQDNSQGQLQKSIGLLDATMIVSGIMIGSGIFITSSDIAQQTGSAGWLLATWLITGIITLLGALSYGELGGMYPQAGGQYVYLREIFNPLVAFLYGWTFFMVIQCGSIAAVGVAFGKFLGVLVPWLGDKNELFAMQVTQDYTYKITAAQLVGIASILFLTWVNTRGIKTGKSIQNLFTFAKIGSLIGLIGFGMVLAYNSDVIKQNFSDMWSASSLSFNEKTKTVSAVPLVGWGIVVALAVAQVGSLFSSDGWNNITFAAGEVVNPKKNVPMALALGTGIVTLLYLLANLTYTLCLPITGLPLGTNPIEQGIAFAENGRVGSNAAEMILPGSGALVMGFLIMVSTFGCNNGMILAGARCYYAMAKDKLFFKSNAELNSNGAPANALWAQCLWSCVLCLSGQYGNLLDYVVFAVLIFYVITIAGIFVMRKREPQRERPIKAIGYPILPALYIVLATFICIVLLIEKPMFTYPGLAIVLLGIPVFYLWKPKSETV